MKALLITFTLVLSLHSGYAQIEKGVDKIAADRFEHYYNDGKYDSIYFMLSVSMKNTVTAAKNDEFFSTLKSKAGSIIRRQFTKYQGTTAYYKTTFEKATKTVTISVNSDLKIQGISVKPYTAENSAILERNVTKLKLPFDGEWTVMWGGDTKELNYHVTNQAQKNAFDILIKDENGKTHQSNGVTNEDYYAFGKSIIAPCDGEVVLAVNGIKDNVPGEVNPIYGPGNSVIIMTAQKEFLLFAHLKQNFMSVKEGQKIKQGQLLGLCGNSGNSTEPHLHFHIQNMENMNDATGVKCYFDQIMVNGKLVNDYSPIRVDRISNAGK